MVFISRPIFFELLYSTIIKNSQKMEKLSTDFFGNSRTLRSMSKNNIETELSATKKVPVKKSKSPNTKTLKTDNSVCIKVKSETSLENTDIPDVKLSVMSPLKRKLKSESATNKSVKTEDILNVPDIEKIKVKSETILENTVIPDIKLSVKSPLSRKLKSESAINKSVKTEKDIANVPDIEESPWEPENWREVLENILKMRKLHVAPVDSLGCEECPDKDANPEVFRYQTLISVMLSSQTKDEVTYAATQRLIEHGLTVDSILNTPDEVIGKLIYPAGFWKSKVQYMKKTSQILKDKYNSDIPRTFKELCSLPGVGPKMANIAMSVAWNDTVGIAVDTHVHRISNRLGWVKKPTKDPEQTRKELEKWLPKKLWKDISLDLVGFGQTICKPIKPKCQECYISKACPFFKKEKA